MSHAARLGLTTLIAALAASGSALAAPQVQVIDKPAAHRVDVLVDGQPFTAYLYPRTLEKPVLYPLRTPAGVVVTRGFPLEPRPGERADHPHHVGHWFNFGDVNGFDFWGHSSATPAADKPKMGVIVHKAVVSAKSGEGRGELVVRADWVIPDGTVLIEEETRFVFIAESARRAIDRQTTWKAGAKAVTFNDTKEGAFGIRVARGLEHPSTQPEVFVNARGEQERVPRLDNTGVTGRYLGSDGTTGEAVWGTRGPWMSLSGTVDGKPVTVAIFDHPGNHGYPNYWHARGYGLFAANPFGRHAFDPKQPEAKFTLEPGQSMTFRHRILLQDGALTAADLQQENARFAGGAASNAAPASDRVARVKAVAPELDRLFAAFAERNHVPGIAYGVLVDGALAHSGSVGVRELATRSAIDADTVFRIASMTKSFTALCILKLRDAGKLSLDDPAERYVPELARLRYPTSDAPKLTVRHLLTHSAGFPEDNPWGDQQLAATEEAFTRMLDEGIPFSTSPGTAYEYSNYGFAILGRIVTRVSGVPYATYVRREILEPLGLTATTLDAAAVPANRRALGYRWEDEQWKEEPPLPDGAFGAMGGMLTSTRDLSKYVGYLMSAWPARDGADAGPVSRASLREMQQPWRARPAIVTGGVSGTPLTLANTAYGYGLGIRQTCDVRQIVSHSGGLPGFGSQMRWLVDEGIGFVAMGNLTYTGWGGVLDEATALLSKGGAVTRAMPAASPALLQARQDVSRLVDRWDDALADQVAAMNLYLDRSKDRRRRDIETLRAPLGTCRPDEAFDVENALRGQWNLTCEKGALRVAITLAPTMPAKVQYLSVTPAPATPPARACGQ